MVSTKTRVTLALAVAFVYVLAYAPLHHAIGTAAGIFATLPVVTAGLLLGFRGGLVAGLLTFPVNSILILLLTAVEWNEWVLYGGSFGSAAAVLVGAITGRLRDLGEIAQKQLDERKRAEAELESFARKLERSNRELEDFATVAAHDLQEPLRKIQTFGERLRAKHRDALSPQGLDYLDRMEGAAVRMGALINDLLTFSRVTTKNWPFVPVDLNKLTRDVVSDLEARLEEVGGRVDIGDLQTVDADPMQIRQLLQNLIGNGLKFHRPDAPPIVSVHSWLPNGSAGPGEARSVVNGLYKFAVEDNGIGFDERYLDRIFTIFQRLHGRGQYQGTGVGLALCRKIAERHGGTITARSTPGDGSTFIVALPVKTSEELHESYN